jgi:quinoprotein glucose dehydrogenase
MSLQARLRQVMAHRVIGTAVRVLVVALLVLPVARAAEPAPADWPHFGRDAGGSQFSPLRDINAGNVKKLRVAWTHRSGDFVDAPSPKGTAFQATPIHVNDTLYYCTPFGRVFALDPATGRERWVFDARAADPATGKPVTNAPRMGVRCRGVAYWEDSSASAGQGGRPAACARRIFTHGDSGRIYALDANTGRLCSGFGAARGHAGFVSHNDYENHGEGFGGAAGSPPVMLGDLVISGTAVNDGLSNARDGIVRAFDARSGELRWEFNPIPVDKRAVSGAANVWSTISVDPVRRLVFLPTTSPSTDYYGGGRQFDIPLANAIVALDGDTGAVKWSFQSVRHDLFDYDLVGHPLLVDIRRDGRTVPAALLQTKMGWLFGFERETGKPLWPIVDMPVPKSDVPGENAATTQPVPQGMAAFARQTMRREELFGLTPIDRAACQRRFDELRYEGMYTPPSVRGSLLFPSALGGGNWGGAAYDPASNLLIIKAENLATVLRVIRKQDPAKEDAIPGKDYLTRPLQGTPYRIEGELFESPLGIPCTPTPWGTLTALDLGTGKIRWQMPLGQIRRAGITIPKKANWGSPNVGGPIVTAGGIIFIGAAMDQKLRALDVKTGRELWAGDLPAPGMAVPMTYVAGGRQYVAIAAGGSATAGTKISDALVAFAIN